MQMERERRHTIANGGYSYHTNGNYSNFCKDYSVLKREKNQSLPTSTLTGAGFIEHPVSRFDTLAGVAIKYGVEVADIKRMNGLVTDLQMFALKSLQIPLPGQHPPSSCLSNGSETPGQSTPNQGPNKQLPSDLLDSFQSLRLKTPPRKVSPAMSSLQGYYGLKPAEKQTSEGFEMAVYRKGEAHYLEDGPFLKPVPSSNPPLSLPRKCRSLVNGFLDENGEVIADIMSAAEAKEGESDKSNEKLIIWQQKLEADFTTRTPEKLLKEDSTSGGSFSNIAAKGLALRSKATSRTNLGPDSEVAGNNSAPNGVIGDGYVADGFSVVRKSSSTPSLQDQDSSSLSSLWPTSKWNLKPDLQALSTVSITRPIFDGLPKPISMSGRKNKAALD